MKNDKLIRSWNRIAPDDSADERMLSGILEQNHRYIQKQENSWMKKIYIPRIAGAAALLCICLAGTVMVSAGALKGFFRDVMRIDGAVTGTVYENADQELGISVSAADDGLHITLECPDAVPYTEIEEWTITGYRIADAAGNTVMENEPVDWSKASGGTVELIVPLALQKQSAYRLVITEFTGRRKADQDLPVRGNWECTFEY